MCTHCLLSPLISLSLSFHIRAHKIYWCLCSRTGSDPSLFLLFWSPFYTTASCCSEPKDCWVEPPCEEGRWYFLPVLFIVSALTLSGNLSSPPNPPHPTSSIIWSRTYFGPRMQGRWGVLGNIQDCSKAFSHLLPLEVGTFPISQQRSGGNQLANPMYYIICLFQCKQKTLWEGFVLSQVSFWTLMRFGCP